MIFFVGRQPDIVLARGIDDQRIAARPEVSYHLHGPLSLGFPCHSAGGPDSILESWTFDGCVAGVED